jgi:hypothetical protein
MLRKVRDEAQRSASEKEKPPHRPYPRFKTTQTTLEQHCDKVTKLWAKVNRTQWSILRGKNQQPSVLELADCLFRTRIQ